MGHLLRFALQYRYPGRESGITVPVRVSLAGHSVDLVAKVDTGAACCVFQREVGEQLGLVIEAGLRQQLATVMGSFWVFGHTVRLETLGVAGEAMVYFAEPERFPRNVLGQRGWLDHVRLALIDYKSLLYLGRYEP